VLVDWDGDFVVYNPLSGDTHILQIDSGEVLRAVTRGDVADDAIRAHLARVLELPEDRQLAGHVDRILGHLHEVGLIEPVE